MDIKNIINQLTLEEKASLCSLKNFWQTQGIERLGIPSITLADGPCGVVRRLSDFSDFIPTTCFPTSSALSSSWDIDLVYSVAKAIGKECQTVDVQILLAPTMNIQRTPLGGKNFEYYSEDPVLSGEIAAAFILGLQSEGIGACIKYYLADDQEYNRKIINNIIDEKTLMELYLNNFEIAVKKGNPLAAMTAHNSVNGTPCSENSFFLTDVLRSEWNFNGIVLSDLFGINSIIDALQAGLNLELPYSYGINTNKIIEGVLKGVLDISVLDKAVEDILKVIFEVTEAKKETATYDKLKHNELAREAAENSMILLKNKHNILPLRKDKLKNKKIALIGEYAKEPRYQGKGTYEVIPTMFENTYDEIYKLVGNSIKLAYAKGYNDSNQVIDDDDILLREAKKIAKESDIVILFLGTSEFSDEENINLPDNQVRLIREIGKIHKNVIVVLFNGSPVSISPWGKYTDAILETWLSGQACGGAIADILFGIVNPSGKLPLTFPIKVQDIPTYLDYVDSENNLEYKEGIYIGYRYYDIKDINVEYPFGFGLSYTTFDYSDLSLNNDVIKETDTLELKLKVKNTGKYFGKEIIQLYVKNLIRTNLKPLMELKAFTKITLFPGEEKEVIFKLNSDIFSHFNIVSHNWVIESGPYEILIGKSSRDIVLSKNLYVQSSYVPQITYTRNTLIGEFIKNQKSKPIIEPFLRIASQNIISSEDQKEQFWNYLKSMPIKKLIILSKGAFTEKMLADIIKLVNE